MGDVAPEATKALLVVVGQEGPIPLDAELCCAPGELLSTLR